MNSATPKGPSKAAQRPLRAEALFAAAIRSADTAMVIVDARAPDTPIIFANAAFSVLTGYTGQEARGRNCRFLQGPATDRAQVARLREALHDGRGVALDLLNYRKDGSTFWNALTLSPVRDASGEVAYVLGVQHDVTDRKIAETAMQQAIDLRTAAMDQALARATTLLHEVDHRVKNNLQLIASLLLLQGRRTPDPTAREALQGMLQRVNAIATVHRRLFNSGDLERFDVAEFVRDLSDSLLAASGRDDVRLTLELERAAIGSAQAAPFALVFNELFGNALRHGVDGRAQGAIGVQVRRLEAGLELVVADDGTGFSAPEAEVRGFGLTIAHLLCRQLGGVLTFNDTQPGVRAAVSLTGPP